MYLDKERKRRRKKGGEGTRRAAWDYKGWWCHKAARGGQGVVEPKRWATVGVLNPTQKPVARVRVCRCLCTSRPPLRRAWHHNGPKIGEKRGGEGKRKGKGR